MTGVKKSNEHKKAISMSQGGKLKIINTPHYRKVHYWIKVNKGQPSTCENCNKQNLTRHQIHWANISQEYKFDFTDWRRLCQSCHKLHDNLVKRSMGNA